jgi:tRNA(Met) cytidine acetyltransferase
VGDDKPPKPSAGCWDANSFTPFLMPAGFDVSAFAALSGTLRAGSWLVLLVPPLADWADRPDSDSLRWSDAEPIATPHFVHHFCRTLAADPDAIVWQQHRPLSVPVARFTRLAARQRRTAARAG